MKHKQRRPALCVQQVVITWARIRKGFCIFWWEFPKWQQSVVLEGIRWANLRAMREKILKNDCVCLRNMKFYLFFQRNCRKKCEPTNVFFSSIQFFKYSLKIFKFTCVFLSVDAIFRILHPTNTMKSNCLWPSLCLEWMQLGHLAYAWVSEHRSSCCISERIKENLHQFARPHHYEALVLELLGSCTWAVPVQFWLSEKLGKKMEFFISPDQLFEYIFTFEFLFRRFWQSFFLCWVAFFGWPVHWCSLLSVVMMFLHSMIS